MSLIDPNVRVRANDVTGILAAMRGRSAEPRRIAAGLYEIGHFSFDTLISKRGGNLHDEDDWDPYANDLPGNCPCFGVCDSVEQFMQDRGHALAADARDYCVSFTQIRKADEPPEGGGWRWHKWGEYIGRGKPTTEYLAHEPEFEEVWCFSVFRKKERA